MKQIIPFKKELLFKTKVSEITSISLEHTLTLKNDDLISGEFYISGDYKMTEGSINRENFYFKLPFDIALDSRYNIDSIIIDIDNFYYQIINSEALQVNIDVYVEGEKIEELPINIEEDIIEKETLKEVSNEEVLLSIPEEDPKEERNEIEIINTKENFKIEKEEEFEKIIEPPTYPKASLVEKSTTKDFNFFDNIDSSDTYMTYYVYIVKEEDNLEKILTKYNVTKDDLALYNNIEDIKPGTKLIIPSTNNE